LLDTREVAIVSDTPSGAEDGRPRGYLLDFEDNEVVRGDPVDLTDRDLDGQFIRSILRCFHPTEFGLNPSDILL
jgi:hypothetical protein